jgi:hypothetical protein
MTTIELKKELGQSVLSTRPLARSLEQSMREAANTGEITLDASGILRASISFFDEALLIFNSIVDETGRDDLKLIYRDVNAALTLKDMPRYRGLTLAESPSGDWIISK